MKFGTVRCFWSLLNWPHIVITILRYIPLLWYKMTYNAIEDFWSYRPIPALMDLQDINLMTYSFTNLHTFKKIKFTFPRWPRLKDIIFPNRWLLGSRGKWNTKWKSPSTSQISERYSLFRNTFISAYFNSQRPLLSWAHKDLCFLSKLYIMYGLEQQSSLIWMQYLCFGLLQMSSSVAAVIK